MKWSEFGKTCYAFNGIWRSLKLSRPLCPATSEKRLSILQTEPLQGRLKEIVRQQWNFSPPNSMREVEEYQVDLSGVNVLELVIVPDISGGVARASLKSLRVS